MKTLFWKAYYKIKFGKNYAARMHKAASMMRIVDQSTVGNLSHFYDVDGNQIRGWHRHIRFAKTVPIQHPLITKYGK